MFEKLQNRVLMSNAYNDEHCLPLGAMTQTKTATHLLTKKVTLREAKKTRYTREARYDKCMVNDSYWVDLQDDVDSKWIALLKLGSSRLIAVDTTLWYFDCYNKFSLSEQDLNWELTSQTWELAPLGNLQSGLFGPFFLLWHPCYCLLFNSRWRKLVQ